MKTLRLLSAILLMGGIAFAQTASSSTATLTIVPALPAPSVNIAPPTQTVQVGQTVTYNITVAGPSGSSVVPTGTITLEAEPTGTNAYQTVASYPLTNGAVTCTYTAPNSIGTYNVHVLYGGDAKYSATN